MGKLAKEADRLWAKVIKLPGKCAICGKGEPEVQLQAAHLASRRYRNTRWALDNGVPLCAGHHVAYTFDPLGWEDWLIERLGEEGYRALKRRARQLASFSHDDMRRIVGELQIALEARVTNQTA